MNKNNNNLLLGRWSLESCIAIDNSNQLNREVFLGEDPFGSLIFTDFYMMVFTSTANPEFINGKNLGIFSTSDPQQVLQRWKEFDCYCGIYQINYQENYLVFNLEGSKLFCPKGTQVKRYYNFLENNRKLVLKTFSPIKIGDIHWNFEVQWNKEE